MRLLMHLALLTNYRKFNYGNALANLLKLYKVKS